MPGNYRAVYLTENWLTTDDGTHTRAPRDWWEGGTGQFIDRISRCFEPAGQGVVLLAAAGAALLGLPDVGSLPLGGVDHPAVQEATRAGWTVGSGRVGDWTTFRAPGRPEMRLGLVHMMNLSVDRLGRPTRTPLYGPTPRDMVRAAGLWHRLTGSAWVGSPGMAGMEVMEDLAPARDDAGTSKAPTWKPKGFTGPDGAVESDYQVEDFRRPAYPYRYLHAYDANRAYIAAAMLLEACPWTLKHTGRTVWNPRLAGWWQVRLSPWVEKRLPNPAGYAPDDDRAEVRWVTGPTMALLHELTERGIYGGVQVLDSWTGPARKGALRPWAERMRDAYEMYDPATRREIKPRVYRFDRIDAPAADVERVRWALKCAGRETLGLLDRKTNWAYRPDWWYAIIALTRANLFRKMLKTAYPSDGTEPRWPVRIDVDNVYYASDEADAEKAAPAAFPIDNTGMQLGAFKTKYSFKAKYRSKVKGS